MTNAEKFTTAEERVNAFSEWCRNRSISACLTDARNCGKCRFSWLDLEAEEEKPILLPCPYCGSRAVVCVADDHYRVTCEVGCGYYSARAGSRDEVIENHNRVVRASMEAGKKEVK